MPEILVRRPAAQHLRAQLSDKILAICSPLVSYPNTARADTGHFRFTRFDLVVPMEQLRRFPKLKSLIRRRFSERTYHTDYD